METIIHCPVCSHQQFNTFLTCTDYLVSQKEFTIQQCKECGFRFTNPRPDSNHISAYYKSDQYVSHHDSGGGLINSIYRLVRSYTLQQKLKLINQFNTKPGHLLDVGCGTGTFLKTCQQAGWQVMGMEPDDDARSITIQKTQIDIQPSLDKIHTDKAFDIITLWHVLEHVPDLDSTIQILYSLLSPKGVLLIAVPNSNSYDAQHYNQYWAAYDVPRHLYHFTPSTIQKLFEKYNFNLIEQRPMLFDAFYIAMMSSKYRTGKTQYLESVRVGLQSNIQAHQTGQASSLIYLFNKRM